MTIVVIPIPTQELGWYCVQAPRSLRPSMGRVLAALVRSQFHTRQRKRNTCPIILVLLGLILTSVPALGEEMQALTVNTGERQWVFQVEVAQSEERRKTGLMYRTELPEMTGMLFDYGREGPVAMWMKNTYIPLDMLFINDRGIIVFIAENTVPHSLEPIRAAAPVSAVLEIAGGTAENLSIAVGHTVEHPLFPR